MKIELLILFCFFVKNSAGFSLASYYQDNMVLQRTPHRAIIWGYASQGSVITLTLFSKTYSTTADKPNGANSFIWEMMLDPIDYNDPVDLKLIETIKDQEKNFINLNNILFGDVWLCGGQSNMQLSLVATDKGEEEIINGYQYKKLRLFSVDTFSSENPEIDVLKIKQNWSLPTKESLNGTMWSYFLAVCWHFGKTLSKSVSHPIGLLVSCWGGTEVERWSSDDVLNTCNNKRNANDSKVWNSMIHPLLKFPIYGAIWYQGESNTGNLELALR